MLNDDDAPGLTSERTLFTRLLVLLLPPAAFHVRRVQLSTSSSIFASCQSDTHSNMATPPEPLQPTPQDVLEALRLVLVPQPQLKKLPSALQFFAHLQLLSAQLRSEAIRALKAHKGLMVQLEEHGVVDDQDVMDWGVLTIREGEALEKVAGNKAEFPREDIMMELSLEFRLLVRTFH